MIKVAVTIEEKGLIGKIKSFFLRRKIAKIAKVFAGMPAEKVLDIMAQALTEQGRKFERTPNGITYTKESK